MHDLKCDKFYHLHIEIDTQLIRADSSETFNADKLNGCRVCHLRSKICLISDIVNYISKMRFSIWLEITSQKRQYPKYTLN